MSITILLADDHTILRQGLRALLEDESDFHIIGEANSGQEALARIEELKPDILVLDLALPDMSGLEVIRRLHYNFTQTHVVVLSMHARGAYVQEALKFGAKGYVLKGSDAKELVQAIRLAKLGQRYLSPSLAQSSVEAQFRLTQSKRLDPLDTLTNREREILPLAASGMSSSGIGETLSISPRTVEVHRARILHKLGLQNQAELIRYALQRGILPFEEST
jgi:two-component system, NarL family, response regulator NreC